LDFVALAPLAELYVSVVSFAEIRYGIALSPDAQKRTALEEWLTLKVRPMFDPQRVLPVTEDIILKWRLLMEYGRKTGHTFSQPDLIIAATAIQHRMTVVTRDQSQFRKANVPVTSPWES
jgi:toxin FitB